MKDFALQLNEFVELFKRLFYAKIRVDEISNDPGSRTHLYLFFKPAYDI